MLERGQHKVAHDEGVEDHETALAVQVVVGAHVDRPGAV